MSHHFDTKLAKEDPSLNVCDFYLFRGADAATTVMAMTVNPDVGLSASDVLHNEGLYAFRFDLNGDSREELAFKFRFGEPRHRDGDEHTHIQKFRVLRATEGSIGGDAGALLIEGESGKVYSHSGVSAFVGVVPELFAGDAVALRGFLNAFYEEQRFNGDAFLNRQNFFTKRNIVAIVLEVPTSSIGRGAVHAWATASLYGHAPEMQVSRWGLPLISHIFLSDPHHQELKELYNASSPADDLANLAKPIGEFAERMSGYADNVVNPSEYGAQLVARLLPIALPYELGTQAAFDHAGFNGRPLADDVMDIMLTLACNRPIADGVVPDRTRTRTTFPYYGEPYSKDEQAAVVPVPRPGHK